MGHDFFRWIGVLDDEVAGVARHHYGLHRTLRTFANGDHIGDVNEMSLHPLTAVETGGAGRLDDGLEPPIIRVAENFGKVATGPEFAALWIGPTDDLKGGDFLAHKVISSGFWFTRRREDAKSL